MLAIPIYPLLKSALFSGLLLIVFFSYSRLYPLLKNISIAGLLVGRRRFLIAFFAQLSVLSLVLLIRWRGNLGNFTTSQEESEFSFSVLLTIPHLPGKKFVYAHFYTTHYYFPDQDYLRLYSTITPVNTIRVVLNQFFHQNYPLLPDNLLVKDVSKDGWSTIRRMPSACDLR